MGWLSRLLGATPKDELDGIRLDTSQPFWELAGRTKFPPLLRALADLLPDGCILYFEGGSPGRGLLPFLRTRQVPEQCHVAVGTLWPRPQRYHVPATPQNLTDLAKTIEPYITFELAVHFHVYRTTEVLLQWHDAFTEPMFLAGAFPENKVRAFADALAMTVTRRNPSVQNA